MHFVRSFYVSFLSQNMYGKKEKAKMRKRRRRLVWIKRERKARSVGEKMGQKVNFHSFQKSWETFSFNKTP